MRDTIVGAVKKIKGIYKTTDPFSVIELAGINLLFDGHLGKLKGYYLYINRERYIVINDSLDNDTKILVAAHELGHDQLHRDLSKNGPLRDYWCGESISNIEAEANMFAAELLIADEDIVNYSLNDIDYYLMCRILKKHPSIVSYKVQSMINRGYHYKLPEEANSTFLRKI